MFHNLAVISHLAMTAAQRSVTQGHSNQVGMALCIQCKTSSNKSSHLVPGWRWAFVHVLVFDDLNILWITSVRFCDGLVAVSCQLSAVNWVLNVHPTQKSKGSGVRGHCSGVGIGIVLERREKKTSFIMARTWVRILLLPKTKIQTLGRPLHRRCPNSLAGSQWTSDVKAELDL